MSTSEENDDFGAVAVIGMAGRFPKSPSVDALWENLLAGRECLTTFTDEELLASGVKKADLANPGYVRVDGVLDGVELFDAPFFDIGPREASMIDPQHRLGLEVAWEALEDAGYDPERTGGTVGVFAGVGISSYFLHNVLPEQAREANPDLLSLQMVMDKDFFATRIAYKLNLRGPCLNIVTACSTSLVAIHEACQSLLAGECRLALAGGANIHVIRPLGYLFQEGSYRSPDGRCRAFDADGKGTSGGNGLGFVVLKRLEDALADGDTIRAVVRGSAINNDGSGKVGFTAPSVEGQARAIAEALAVAGLSADAIGYVEAHGTGTTLGDPIEVAALTRAFRGSTQARQYCALGSIKPNIGHLGAAAGVAGFIKAALAVEARTLPASLNYRRPNPAIDFPASPFFVNDRLTRLPLGGPKLRAGVSSFGIGGTNAHAILEEPPPRPAPAPGRPFQLLPLTAKTEPSLDGLAARLTDHLATLAPSALPDTAYTLHAGRRPFPLRRALVATASGGHVVVAGEARGSAAAGEPAKIAFLFPGGGTQHVGMGRDLHAHEPAYREAFDRCAAIVRAETGIDLAEVLFRAPDGEARLRRTSVGLPAIFATEWAMVALLRAWGIEPSCLLGHSLGEYTAACVAGVLPLEAMLRLVCRRGALFEKVEAGAMLGVPLAEAALRPLLPAGVSLAAVNGPEQCVASGTVPGIEALEAALVAQGVEPRRLVIDAAGHSSLLEPILDELEALVRTLPLAPPQIPYVSNLTGTWIRPEEATDPRYYRRHLRETVRFAAGVRALLGEARLLVEVGPGTALATAARLQASAERGESAVSAMRHAREEKDDRVPALVAVGHLWANGGAVDLAALQRGEARRRVRVPTYAFDRQRYWIEPGELPAMAARPAGGALPKAPLDDWFWSPVWRRSLARGAAPTMGADVLVIAPAHGGLGGDLAAALAAAGARVTLATAASAFRVVGEERLELDPGSAADHRQVLEHLAARGRRPATIVHLLTHGALAAPELAHGALVHLGQALAGVVGRTEIVAVTSGLERVRDDDPVDPRKALLVGPARVLPYELDEVSLRVVDVPAELTDPGVLAREVLAGAGDELVALRGGLRFVRDYAPLALPAPAASPFAEGGTYLVTGGLGGMGLTLARHLAKGGARLVLVTRSDRPAPELPGARDVLVVKADLAVPADVDALAATVRAQVGAIDGIFHFAGLNHEATLAAVTPEGTTKVLGPKVTGTELLWGRFRAPTLRFFLLASSLSVATSSYGGVDYVSANAFLDAFAARHEGEATFVAAIDWDIWDEVGMLVAGDLQRMLPYLDEEHIAPAEGVEVVRRVLAGGASRVVVSTRDFAAIRRKNAALFAKTAAAPAEPEARTRPRKAFPRPSLAVPYAAPSTATEQRLVAIWEEVLGIAPIGVHDNFFALGGESVVAVQLLSKAKQARLGLTPRQMFEGPTVAQMAALVDAGAALAPAAPAAPVAVAAITAAPLPGAAFTDLSAPELAALVARFPEVEDVLPPTPLQLRMVHEGARPRAFRAYLNQSVLTLADPVDASWLRSSWQAVVDRHAALRTAFVTGPRGLLAVVHRRATLPFAEQRLEVTDAADAAQKVAALLADDRARGFDVGAAPLLRVTLVHLAGGVTEDRILVTSHHAIVDGWSSGLLMADLFAAATGHTSAEPPPSVREILAWRRARGGEAAARAFWADALAGYEAKRLLPAPTASPAALQHVTETSLGAPLTTALRRAARDAAVTVNTLVQAAWARALGELSGARDVVFGITIAGRPATLEGVAAIVGQCTSSLPLRVRLDDAAGTAWLRALHAASLAVMEHDDVAVEPLDGEGLYETNLIFENVPTVDAAELELPGFRVRGSTWSEAWHFPLRLFVFPGDALAVRMASDPARVDPAVADRLVERLRAELVALAGLAGIET